MSLAPRRAGLLGPDLIAALPSVRPPVVADQPRRAFVAHIMGLPMSVHVRGPKAHAAEVAAAVAAAFVELRADDASFSTWNPGSPVSRIRRGELRLEDAGERVREVARLCRIAAEVTDGSFSAWLPGPDGDPAFDPSGLVKGWAVESAFARLEARLAPLGAHDLLMSAGGDVVVGCSRTDTPAWVVGVEDPMDGSRTVLRIPLRRGAVATSGTAARGHHILDPRTGSVADGVLSATVVGPSLTWADVYATAAFVRGEDALPWLATLADHTGCSVDRAGRLRRARSEARAGSVHTASTAGT